MSSPSSALERNVRRICSKLRAIAKLRFGDKWNSTTQKPDRNTIFNNFLRWGWYWNESKENSVNDFTVTFEEAYVSVYEILSIYILSDTNYKAELTVLLRELTGQIADTKMAMIRQKGTYVGSDDTKDELDKIIRYITDEADKVAAQVKKLGMVLPCPQNITASSPSRFNPVHIPVAEKKDPEKKDNIEKEEINEINVEFDGFGTDDESNEEPF